MDSMTRRYINIFFFFFFLFFQNLSRGHVLKYFDRHMWLFTWYIGKNSDTGVVCITTEKTFCSKFLFKRRMHQISSIYILKMHINMYIHISPLSSFVILFFFNFYCCERNRYAVTNNGDHRFRNLNCLNIPCPEWFFFSISKSQF